MGTCFQDLLRQQSDAQSNYMDFSKFPPEYYIAKFLKNLNTKVVGLSYQKTRCKDAWLPTHFLTCSSIWVWKPGQREKGQMLEMLLLGNLARETDAGDAFACKDALVTDCRRRRDGRQGQPVRKNCCAFKRLEEEFQDSNFVIFL